jgi:PadR family transcriptional regulator, regulatory protein PadR
MGTRSLPQRRRRAPYAGINRIRFQGTFSIPAPAGIPLADRWIIGQARGPRKVLLRLLDEKERYGYELSAELAARRGGAFELKEGTLYPVLYRLESAGKVEPYWQTQDRGVPRKYYRITAAGREALQQQVLAWSHFVEVVGHLLGGNGNADD